MSCPDADWTAEELFTLTRALRCDLRVALVVDGWRVRLRVVRRVVYELTCPCLGVALRMLVEDLRAGRIKVPPSALVEGDP